MGQQGAVQLRDGQEEVPVLPQPVAVDERRLHVDGLVLGLGLGLRGAHVDADPTAGAVVSGDSDGHVVTGEILGTEGLGQEPVRSPGEHFGGEHLHADDSMRADDRALAAVDAYVRVPYRHLERDGSLLVASRPGRKASIGRKSGHRQQVTPAVHEHRGHVLDEVRGRFGDRDADRSARGSLFGNLHLDEVGKRRVDGGEVAVHDGVTPLAVGLGDRGLDLGHRLIGWQYSRKGEEARLHHCVDPVAELGLRSDLVGVDHPELNVLVLQLTLHLAR